MAGAAGLRRERIYVPANVAGAIDAPLDLFGGLVSEMAAADLPQGVSPDCADVRFIPGGVQTRPGLLSILPVIAGNPTVNYLKTFERSEEHTSELQSQFHIVCRLLLEK